MKTLIIQNNFFLVPELKVNFDRILFSPSFHSEVQRKFFETRFFELKKVVPLLEWSPKAINATEVLSWDGHVEKKLFGSKIIPIQNRLFLDLPFKIPEVFTTFREHAESHLPPFYPEARAPYDEEVIQAIKSYFWEKKLPKSYFETRNEMTGTEFSTRFSAYLSCGALDVKYLYNEVKRFEREVIANKSTYWIIFELLWREYFYWHYQKHQSAYFSENGIKGPKDFSSYTTYDMANLEILETHPFFKAALSELKSTGFMSNRARQMFASYWLNDLGLNWRAGANLFENHLIDYDVYSNYGNWMYLAGVGVDPRGKRYFNIDKQLSVYDPHGKYIKQFLKLPEYNGDSL